MVLEGQPVRLSTSTRYPWDGDIAIEVETAGHFELNLRIPAWCEGEISLEVNGKSYESALTPGSYASIRRDWQSGDTIRLRLPCRCAAWKRTPIRQIPSGGWPLCAGRCSTVSSRPTTPAWICATWPYRKPPNLRRSLSQGLLNGVVTLRGSGTVTLPGPSWQDRLYRKEAASAETPAPQVVELKAVPYYAWANREPGRMLVWLRAQ